MTDSLKWRKLDYVENGEFYSISLDFPYSIRNDRNGRILNPYLHKTGYYRVDLYANNKRKTYNHHNLIWISHYGTYDKSKYMIDHHDRCRSNNNISNLRLVSRSINGMNRKADSGKEFNYYTNLPDKIVINEEHNIYYCKAYNKFFRKVLNDYRELHERKHSQNNGTIILWRVNGKLFHFTTTHFRDTLT